MGELTKTNTVSDWLTRIDASRNELIEHIYTTDCELDSNVIDVYINYLRNKIDKTFASPLIHTVRGAGYILKAEA